VRTGVFGPRQCDRIVDLGLAATAGPGDLLDGPGPAPTEVRDCTVAWLGPESGAGWVREKLAAVVASVNRHYGFELTGGGEELQFTTYRGPGGHYTWHQDGLDLGVERRKLAAVVQLSDPADYRGGELEFLEVSEDYDDAARAAHVRRSGARGSVVVFPAFEYHRVRPVRSGTRHSLVWWVDGPPFR
jgi:PKHD-type hydroxylase